MRNASSASILNVTSHTSISYNSILLVPHSLIKPLKLPKHDKAEVPQLCALQLLLQRPGPHHPGTGGRRHVGSVRKAVTQWGALMGSPQCRMSILQKGNVPCRYFCNFHSVISHAEFKERSMLCQLYFCCYVTKLHGACRF